MKWSVVYHIGVGCVLTVTRGAELLFSQAGKVNASMVGLKKDRSARFRKRRQGKRNKSINTRKALRHESLESRVLLAADIAPPPPTLISGFKWNDADADSNRDRNERGIAGVQIYADINLNGEFDSFEPTTRTRRDDPFTDFDESGFYDLELFEGGIFVVREVVPEGYTQTYPEFDAHLVSVDLGNQVDGVDFGNHRETASVHGVKWNDRNGNGIREDFEQGIPGVTIYVDQNRNDQFDDGEPSTITMADLSTTAVNESGHYWLDDLEPGTHLIREVVPDGYEQTYPERLTPLPGPVSDEFIFEADPQAIVAELAEGETLLTRIKLTELPNTVFDRGPLPLTIVSSNPDFEVRNLTGTIVVGGQGEPLEWDVEITGTGEAAEFSILFVEEFEDIATVDSYVWVEVPVSLMPVGTSGGHIVSLDAGDRIDGIDFGNQLALGSVRGRKWNDANGNGEQDGAEEGLGGVSIYVDLNRNAKLDNNEPTTTTMYDIPETDFDEGGLYFIDGLSAGEYYVREVVPDGYEQTYPRVPFVAPEPINPTYTPVPDLFDLQLEEGEVYTTQVTLDVNADIACGKATPVDIFATSADAQFENLTGVIESFCGTEVAFDVQFVGTGEPERYTLVIADLDEDDSRTYAEIPVFINAEVSGAHVVELDPGQSVEGLDFGNRIVRTGGVGGVKWSDNNANTERDPGEQGLGGVVIYADINNNAVLDDFEPWTRTMEDIPETDFDEAGIYSLELPAGRYSIREVVPDGYYQSYPRYSVCDINPVICDLEGDVFAYYHFVTVEPGQHISGLDFGNVPVASIEGTKWEDANGNFTRDANEPGLAGVTIYIDLDGNARLNNGEPQTNTAFDDPNTDRDETGYYRFDFLPPGEYLVREVVPAGYEQTFPHGLIDAVLYPPNPIVDVQPESIDLNLRLDETHATEISVGINATCVRPFELDIVAEYPNASFENLSGIVHNGCGGDVSTFEVELNGRGITESFNLHIIDTLTGDRLASSSVVILAPGTPAHLVSLGPGDQVSGIDFGNHQVSNAAVEGRKWNDENGNGLFDSGETGLAGVEIYADLDRDGVYDEGEPRTRTREDIPETDFDEGGFYSLGGLAAGEYIIREVAPEGFVQTFPAVLLPQPLPVPLNDPFAVAAPLTISVDLQPGEVHEAKVSVSVEPFCIRPILIDVIASDADIDFENVSGTQLNGCGGDVSEFEVAFASGQVPNTFSIQFVDAESADQSVLASIPVYVGSSRNGGHIVRLAPGEVISGFNFGNQQVTEASVQGRKWRDDDADGIHDSDEPGLAGTLIFADLNNNQRLDANEPSARSMRDNPDTDFDETGFYVLPNLPKGEYAIREQVGFQFFQTYPEPVLCQPTSDPPLPCSAGHKVEIEPGTSLVGLDFGNSPRLIGDADLDGDVDAADRTILTRNWTGARELLVANDDRTWSEADFDNDGDVDSADQTMMTQHWTGAKRDAGAFADLAVALAASEYESSISAARSDSAASDFDAVDQLFQALESDVIGPKSVFFLA